MKQKEETIIEKNNKITNMERLAQSEHGKAEKTIKEKETQIQNLEKLIKENSKKID